MRSMVSDVLPDPIWDPRFHMNFQIPDKIPDRIQDPKLFPKIQMSIQIPDGFIDSKWDPRIPDPKLDREDQKPSVLYLNIIS